ncbi:hypothetical protein ACUMLB_003456 [Escherichia coli]|nr:hypothetical protein [Escherichia coli]EJI0954885.1 hypothetical protein [Escherichia coli]EKG6774972.1 hypothetical protein [Escherichia coli]ELX1524401.1 hypothetical protein [Escherichia coli]
MNEIRILKLSGVHGDPVFVVMSCIESLTLADYTLLRTTSGDNLKVSETPEEIIKMMGLRPTELL